ncbi:MAG: DNA repair exonuclease [Clostridiales bacterium]|nr:DNA repair exonuclease [Candidatus Blautia equi]
MKFIHLADVHLGAVPERGSALGEVREGEIWKTFRRVIESIHDDPVDLLFIAGDLFHRQPLLKELREVNYLFSTIPSTMVFLMAGNHDYLKKNSFYRDYPWAENVIFFDEEEMSCAKAGDLDVYVYSHSYERKEIPERLYDRVRPGNEPGLHILMAHGGDQSHIPFDYRTLSTSGFDYVALGHIHKPQIFPGGRAAYPGSLEPLDRNEDGSHGYLKGTFENGEVKLSFFPAACRSYVNVSLNVKEDTTQFDLEDRLKELILEKGKNNLYLVSLKGRRSPDTVFLPERLMELGNVIEVRDDTRPAFQLGELERRYSGTLVGSYIAAFREKENLTEVEEKALYYGLTALLETNNVSQKIANTKLRKDQ